MKPAREVAREVLDSCHNNRGFQHSIITEAIEAARREGAEEAERKLDIALGCLTESGWRAYKAKTK